MSRPQHPNAGACKARRYPELCVARVPSRFDGWPSYRDPVCEDGDWTNHNPTPAHCENEGWLSPRWTWRERALRAAATRPCHGGWEGLRAFHASRCWLDVEHLHPAVQAAWAGRCAP